MRSPGLNIITDERYRKLFVISAIFILGFIVYGNSFSNDFVFDDDTQIARNTGIRNFGNISGIFRHSLTYFSGSGEEGKFYRPLQSLTLMCDYSRWGLNPLGYHITNTLLHILVAVLLFFILCSITKSTLVAALASLLYTVHPANTEAVTYISGRADSLSAIFLLLMIIFQYRYWLSGGRKKAAYYSLILASFILALLGKEHAVLFPFLLIFFEYCMRDREKYSGVIGKKLLFYIPLFAAAAVWALVKNRIAVTEVMIKHPVALRSRLIMAPRAIFDYVRLTLFPVNLHMEYRFPAFKSLFEHGYFEPFLFTALLLLLVCFLWIKGRKSINYRIMFFGAGFFLISLFPYLNIAFQLNAPFAEHWLYIPQMGLILLIIYALFYSARTSAAKKGMTLLCIIAISACSYLTIRQNTVWKNDFTLSTHIIKYAPYSAHAYNNLAVEYIERGDTLKAKELFEKAIEVDPYYEIAKENLRKLQRQMGETAKPEKDEQVSPARALNEEGIRQGKLGNLDEAIRLFKEAAELDPDSGETYNNLGYAYYKAGDLDRAAEYFKKALEVDPDHVRARQNLDFVNKEMKR